MAEYCTYEKYVLKKKLETLKNKSVKSAELISLYVPSDKQISDVIKHLKEEHEQASNIISKLASNNVREALDSLLAKLRSLNKIPENGIVYFAGVVDTGANRTGMVNEVLILRNPVVHIYITVILFFILSLLRKCSGSAVLMGSYFLI